MMTCSFLTRRLWELQYPAPFYQISHRYHSPPLRLGCLFCYEHKNLFRQVFDILYVYQHSKKHAFFFSHPFDPQPSNRKVSNCS